MTRVVWVVALALASCVRAGAVECSDGSLCAEGTVCDLLHHQCVTDEQLAACDGLDEADRCTAGTFQGICDQNVCIAGCGDGTRAGEECDDGNFASHDGCSSRCTVESATWIRAQTAWTPRARHAAAYHSASAKLVVFGGTDELGPTDQHWERTNKNTWTLRDIPRPSPRLAAAMAYDEQHEKIVLFGGTADVLTATARGLGDTWTYDGQQWTQVTGAGPAPRWGAAMAYAGGGRVLLFGGRDAMNPFGTPGAWLTDTWEFDGTRWTQITTAGPPGRYNTMMAWAPFPGNPRVVLFGGIGDNGGPGGLLADQWEYRRTGGWTQPSNVPNKPTFSTSAALAFIPTPGQERVVMFGGATAQELPSTTYTFDGSGWRTVASTLVPPARMDATLTTVENEVVMVAGRSNNAPLDDVWVFDDGGWVPRPTPQRPRGRGEAELVYDPDAKETLSIGGVDEIGAAVLEVYQFGRAWNPGVYLPDGRRRLVASYDRARRRTVIFGGIFVANNNSTATMTLANGAWSRYTASEPPLRTGGVMAYSDDRGGLVLFGGVAAGATTTLPDTWLFGDSWQKLVLPDGPTPSRRAAMEYDVARKRLVLFDEAGHTWTLAADHWEPLATSGPSARTAAVMAYSQELQALVLYGGVSATAPASLLDDVWVLGETEWTKIDVTGEQPAPRQDPRLVAHPPLRSLLLHGGTAASGRRLDDTWLFQYRSAVPDEICDNGTDDDGDHRIDGKDPDCL